LLPQPANNGTVRPASPPNATLREIISPTFHFEGRHYSTVGL
jgi:hypothetical protein